MANKKRAYTLYSLGRALFEEAALAAVGGTEAQIGIKCTTTTPLFPDDYVRVGTKLWQAHSIAGDIETRVEAVIVGISRLTLLVKLSTDTSFDEGRNSRLETDLALAS